MRHALASLTLVLAALLPGAPSWAGAAATRIAVGITLNNPSWPQSRPGLCLSRSLSERARARVEVTCAPGEFVDIEALPALPFLAEGPAPDESASLTAAQGTVTMIRVFDLMWPEGSANTSWDRPLEMRVTF